MPDARQINGLQISWIDSRIKTAKPFADTISVGNVVGFLNKNLACGLELGISV